MPIVVNINQETFPDIMFKTLEISPKKNEIKNVITYTLHYKRTLKCTFRGIDKPHSDVKCSVCIE